MEPEDEPRQQWQDQTRSNDIIVVKQTSGDLKSTFLQAIIYLGSINSLSKEEIGNSNGSLIIESNGKYVEIGFRYA